MNKSDWELPPFQPSQDALCLCTEVEPSLLEMVHGGRIPFPFHALDELLQPDVYYIPESKSA